MAASLKNSELIINPNGSIYHLALKPEQIADTVVLVGDPERVPMVSNHFDSIEFEAHNREFVTHTGTYKGKRLSVISTGIGTGNIDIVLNEVDALFNVDFDNRVVKDSLTQLTFVRMGTCGGLQEGIQYDEMVVSKSALGFDGLLHFYDLTYSAREQALTEAARVQFHESGKIRIIPYGVDSAPELVEVFSSFSHVGITVSCAGFYGPQGRKIRLRPHRENFLDFVRNFDFEGDKVTNFEMETSGILGIGEALGHKCVSLSTVVANRVTGEFSPNPKKAVNNMIEEALPRVLHL